VLELLEIVLQIKLKFVLYYKFVEAIQAINNLGIFKCKAESNEYQSQYFV
jgi:hypothetical protein